LFSDEAKFHTSGSVSRHNCVVWGNVPSREYLKPERVNPKVDLWCALARGKVFGPFSFDKDIITAIYDIPKYVEKLCCSAAQQQQQQQSYFSTGQHNSPPCSYYP
jgi:hypothetical protein